MTFTLAAAHPASPSPSRMFGSATVTMPPANEPASTSDASVRAVGAAPSIDRVMVPGTYVKPAGIGSVITTFFAMEPSAQSPGSGAPSTCFGYVTLTVHVTTVPGPPEVRSAVLTTASTGSLTEV